MQDAAKLEATARQLAAKLKNVDPNGVMAAMIDRQYRRVVAQLGRDPLI